MDIYVLFLVCERTEELLIGFSEVGSENDEEDRKKKKEEKNKYRENLMVKIKI